MNARERAVATGAGAVAGFAGGLFGVGGGLVLIPILTGFYRLGQHRAHGTSLAVIIATALAAAPVYALHGNVAWVTAVVVGLASIATAPLGARLAGRLSSANLTRMFAVLLVLVAARLLWTPGGAAGARGPENLVLDLAVGCAVGMLAGFMGVGGGVLAVPVFTLLLHMPQQLAQGTSLVVVFAAACSGTVENVRRDNIERPLVPWLALGALIAAPLASWAVQRVPREWLARAFAVFLIANAVHAWRRVARARAA